MKSAKDKKDERVRPRVSMDYFYLTKKNPNKEEDALPLLAILDEPSMRMFSVALPSKGVEHQYNVAVVTKLVKYLGRTDANLAVFKSDTERSLVALRNAVQLRVPGVGCEDAVKGESQTNGPIESAVGRLQGQARTLKSCLESRYQMRFSPRHPILSWLVDYCGTLLSRFQRGPDGFTGYERSTGKRWRIALPEFGECVFYEPVKGERDASKLDAKFEPGIFLGIQEGSGMRWIGTPDGVVRTWTIKRRPDEEKWQKEMVEKFVGLSWQLKPRIGLQADMRNFSPADIEIKVPDVGAGDGDELKEVAVEEKKKKKYVPRGIYIRRDVELEAYGYTEGCDGCEAAKHGLSHKQHSRACKERISGEMCKTEEGKKRVEKVRAREEKYMVAVHEKEEAKKRAAAEELKPDKEKMKRQVEADDVVDAVLGGGNAAVMAEVPVKGARLRHGGRHQQQHQQQQMYRWRKQWRSPTWIWVHRCFVKDNVGRLWTPCEKRVCVRQQC